MTKNNKKQRTTIAILLITVIILSILCIYFNLKCRNQNNELKDINTYLDGKLVDDYDISWLYGKYYYDGEIDNGVAMNIGKSINDCYYSDKDIKGLNIYIFNNNIEYDDGYGSPLVYVLDFISEDNFHYVVSGYSIEGTTYFTELGYDGIGSNFYKL